MDDVEKRLLEEIAKQSVEHKNINNTLNEIEEKIKSINTDMTKLQVEVAKMPLRILIMSISISSTIAGLIVALFKFIQ